MSSPQTSQKLSHEFQRLTGAFQGTASIRPGVMAGSDEDSGPTVKVSKQPSGRRSSLASTSRLSVESATSASTNDEGFRSSLRRKKQSANRYLKSSTTKGRASIGDESTLSSQPSMDSIPETTKKESEIPKRRASTNMSKPNGKLEAERISKNGKSEHKSDGAKQDPSETPMMKRFQGVTTFSEVIKEEVLAKTSVQETEAFPIGRESLGPHRFKVGTA